MIRKATQTDQEQLSKLMYDYIVHFYKAKEPKEEDIKSLITFLLEQPDRGQQFVAEENGDLVGFASLYFTFSTLRVQKQAILNDLYVAPKARGKKLGESLFTTCIEFVRENDFCSMTWETGKDNLVAQKLYDKMGGKISDWLYYEIS